MHRARPGEVIFIAVVGSLGVNFELVVTPEIEPFPRINDSDVSGDLVFEEIHRSFLPLQEFVFGRCVLRDLEKSGETLHGIEAGGGSTLVAFGNLLQNDELDFVSGQSCCHRLELPYEGAAGLLKSGLGDHGVDQHGGEANTLGFADHLCFVVAFAARHPSTHEEDDSRFGGDDFLENAFVQCHHFGS